MPCNNNHSLGRRIPGKTERRECNICDAINDYIHNDEGEHMFLCCKQRDYNCCDICCRCETGQLRSDGEFAGQDDDDDDEREENVYPWPLMLKTRSIPLNEMGEARNNTTIIQMKKAEKSCSMTSETEFEWYTTRLLEQLLAAEMTENRQADLEVRKVILNPSGTHRMAQGQLTRSETQTESIQNGLVSILQAASSPFVNRKHQPFNRI